MTYEQTNYCKNCRQPMEDHCIFEAIMIPEGCVCDPTEWGDYDNIPEICDQYVKGDFEDRCVTCEHLKECHDNKKFNEKRA